MRYDAALHCRNRQVVVLERRAFNLPRDTQKIPDSQIKRIISTIQSELYGSKSFCTRIFRSSEPTRHGESWPSWPMATPDTVPKLRKRVEMRPVDFTSAFMPWTTPGADEPTMRIATRNAGWPAITLSQRNASYEFVAGRLRRKPSRNTPYDSGQEARTRTQSLVLERTTGKLT